MIYDQYGPYGAIVAHSSAVSASAPPVPPVVRGGLARPASPRRRRVGDRGRSVLPTATTPPTAEMIQRRGAYKYRESPPVRARGRFSFSPTPVQKLIQTHSSTTTASLSSTSAPPLGSLRQGTLCTICARHSSQALTRCPAEIASEKVVPIDSSGIAIAKTRKNVDSNPYKSTAAVSCAAVPSYTVAVEEEKGYVHHPDLLSSPHGSGQALVRGCPGRPRPPPPRRPR